MRNLALCLFPVFLAACEDDIGNNTYNPDPVDPQQPVEQITCLPNASVDAYMQAGQYWQVGESGAYCWNDPFQGYEPESWGCINPGHHTRADLGLSLPVAGQNALDCACAWSPAAYDYVAFVGTCDVGVATLLTECTAAASPGVVTVTYTATNPGRCMRD